jgi:hypothetical protein
MRIWAAIRGLSVVVAALDLLELLSGVHELLGDVRLSGLRLGFSTGGEPSATIIPMKSSI